jgi:hypothetical protein
MAFQKIVIAVASILLVISLIIMAVIMARSKSRYAYPPVESECPDYWELQKIGGSNTCVNTKDLGNSSCPSSMDFSVSPWVGSQALCKKQIWARQCDLTWDGITNSTTVCSSNGTPVTPSSTTTSPGIIKDIERDWDRFTSSF